MNDALHAHQIRLELPLNDGDSFLVGIEPQEPSFRKFTSRCLAVFPEPNATAEKADPSVGSPSIPKAVVGPTTATSYPTRSAPTPRVNRPVGVDTEMELLAALDNSIWIPDGKTSEKQIYVIAGPCCAYSQALYRNSRGLGDKVQLRWVEMAPAAKPKCLGYLGEAALRQDSGLLADMYETLAEPRRVPLVVLDNAIRWNRGVETSITPLLQKLDPQHRTGFPYPTLVWLSRGGVKIAVRPDRIDTIINSVSARFEAAAIAPKSREFLHSQYQFASLSGSMFGTPEDGVGAFALPNSNSQLVFTLPKNRGFRGLRQTTVNGETWIELAVYDEAWMPGYFVRANEVRPAH